MLFNTNTMTMINDPNMIGMELNDRNHFIVAAVTTEDKLCCNPNVYDACILMPPTELLLAWADGNQMALQVEYPKYLCSKDPDDMIVALLTALTKKNIILYIPFEEYGIFGQLLLNHFYFMYGIVMNTPYSQFSFDQNKLPYLISKFYMMDLMEPMDYLKSYPNTLLLPEFVIPKLAADLHPFNYQASMQEYANYFNGIVANGRGKNIMIAEVIKNDNIH